MNQDCRSEIQWSESYPASVNDQDESRAIISADSLFTGNKNDIKFF